MEGNPTASPTRSAHDIFLSHSGAQKGFVKGLYKMLHPLYSVFFDITHHSLPPADKFPAHIFRAAKTCKLAVVVLSNEFLCSKWPMLELSAFMDVMLFSEIKILPLFYELSPTDLKDEEKLQGWHKKWEEFASKDGTGRISVSTWALALRTLCPINGLVFNKSDGELAYLEEIVSTISQILPPLIKFTHPGIHGEDRLCQVFIDKFEELESRHHPTSLSKVCVLGVYGLPGSGKTTLSKCLRDRFFPLFAGKVLHLELSTDPTLTELLNKSKELLKLTDFDDRVGFSNTLDLGQVYSILKASNLRSSRVFLVIDNISSQDSIQSVEAILQLGVGAGSRVMLVARTLKILDPLLAFSYKVHHYVCDSMSVPSIDEEEAIRVLMQPGAGLGKAEYNNKVEEELSPNHKKSMVEVVHMCAFHDDSHPKHQLLYLPLVLNIVGGQLRSHGMEIETWERRLRSLQGVVEKFKKDAVRGIVKESFERLPEKCQTLFLDVALFMVPYFNHWINYEASVELLSFMHESSPETIESELQDLISLCFLDLRSSTTIIVHDVLLGFAKCVSDASSAMYYCKKRNLNLSADEQIREMCKSEKGLRAIILELDEKCKRFDFPAGFASVKVLVVRNCKLLAVLGLQGLTSLVSLEVDNCPSLKCVELGAGADQNHLHSLKSMKWANGLHDSENIYDQQQGSFMQMKAWTQEQSIMQVKPWRGLVEYMSWCRMLALSRWPQRPWNGVIDLASQVRGLQVLRLERTGITCLGDASSCWPQLRVLEVLEDRLEQIELGNLPNLKHFFFGDGHRDELLQLKSGFYAKRRYKFRMPSQTNLLVGCPKLEDVRICEPPCEDGMATLKLSSNLHTFWLKHVHHAAPMLPDFTSVAQSLEVLVVIDHWDLRSIDFTSQFSGLVQISLISCRSLTKITGLEGLPNLRDLQVDLCASLRSIDLEGLPNLRDLQVKQCASLRSIDFTCQFSGLVKISLYDCRSLRSIDLEGLPNLRDLQVEECDSLRSIDFTCQFSGLVQISLHSCRSLTKITGLEGLPNVRDLQVKKCASLVSLSNLESLSMLETLMLFQCPLLNVQLWGLDNWVSLKEFLIDGCPNVHFRLGALANLTKLRDIDCQLHSFPCFFNMKNLVNLDTLYFYSSDLDSEMLMNSQLSLCRDEVNGQTSSALEMKCLPSLLIGPSHLSSLTLSGVKNLVSLDGSKFLVTLRSLTLRYMPNLVSLDGIEFLLTLESLTVHELPNLTCLQGIECLIHLHSFHMADCMSVEELPSLRTLVDMEMLCVINCVNLKALEGCDGMRCLKSVRLSGCKKLECLPLDQATLERLRRARLSFGGCKFASIKAMVAWVLDEEVPKVLFGASFRALVWEFTHNLLEKPTERRDLGMVLVETLGVYLSRQYLKDDDYFDFHNWVSGLEESWDWERRQPGPPISFPGTLVELMREVGRVPLKRLLQQCQSDTQIQLSIVHCLVETHPRVLQSWIWNLDFYKKCGFGR